MYVYIEFSLEVVAWTHSVKGGVNVASFTVSVKSSEVGHDKTSIMDKF